MVEDVVLVLCDDDDDAGGGDDVDDYDDDDDHDDDDVDNEDEDDGDDACVTRKLENSRLDFQPISACRSPPIRRTFNNRFPPTLNPPNIKPPAPGFRGFGPAIDSE